LSLDDSEYLGPSGFLPGFTIIFSMDVWCFASLTPGPSLHTSRIIILIYYLRNRALYVEVAKVDEEEISVRVDQGEVYL
jgi:hypothetical protein